MVTAVNEDHEPMVNGESGRRAVEIIYTFSALITFCMWKKQNIKLF